MSSTNVHSTNNIHICAGQAIPTEKGIDIPPVNAKRGPRKFEVIEGPIATILAEENEVIRDGKNIVGRMTRGGEVLSGDVKTVKKVLQNIEKGMEI